MKTKYLLFVSLLLVFCFTSISTSGAAYVHPLNQVEEQTSDTTVCTDVVNKLQKDTVYVDEVFIKIDKAGKILFSVREPNKSYFERDQFVSFRRFVELNHRNHKILQVQFNFNLDYPRAHIFYDLNK